MRSGKLSDDHRQQLLTAIKSRRDWLHRLYERMDATEWKSCDENYRATPNAIAADDRMSESLAKG